MDLDHIKKLSPEFLGAIAGAAAAGAVIFPEHRIIGALGLGGVMLFIALKMTPCCDGCADGKGCGGDAPSSSASQPAPTSTSVAVGELFSASATVASAGRACS